MVENGCGLMISEREKIAWVFGYMKSNYDLFLETGVSSYEAEKLSDSLQHITVEILRLLGVTDVTYINSAISELDSIDMELAVRRALQNAEKLANVKKTSFVF